jgi:hypothetical protein
VLKIQLEEARWFLKGLTNEGGLIFSYPVMLIGAEPNFYLKGMPHEQ